MKEVKRLDGELYRRSMNAIAHGALTNSKRPQSFVQGVYPTHLKKGLGCHVWDTFGNQYVDFIGALGSNLLGYAQEEVCEAVAKQARLGATLSLGTELEVQCAEKVKEFFPFVDRVRFLKTGNEACSAAIRIARAVTESLNVFSEGYHGWSDEFVSLTAPARGVGPHESIFPFTFFSNHSSWDEAAVIVEPIITELSDQRIEWLRQLRGECTDRGALLIFDEVITGFRVPQYSIAREYGIIPDLIVLGKAMGGGLPISVVAGRKEIMESDYFVSSTFAGETLSLAASLKTMELLQKKYKIEHLWEKGGQFLNKFNEIAPEIVQLEGYPTRSILKGSELNKALFMQECCKSNILVGPSLFFTFPHMDVMDEVLSTFGDILNRIKRGEVKLEGELPVKPFAQTTRES